MVQVLLIDDDISVQDLVKVKLGAIFNIVVASSLMDAKQFIMSNTPDIIILDETLPDGLGSDFLEKLNSKYNIPVIMLTADKNIVSKRKAFLHGAVDYITKPFDPEELQLRIDARLVNIIDGVICDLSFDLKIQKVELISENSSKNSAIDLTPAEFKILYLLVDNKNRIYNRGDIISEVWGEDHFIDERTIDQHISKIRKKITLSKVEIHSKHGKGYFAKW